MAIPQPATPANPPAKMVNPKEDEMLTVHQTWMLILILLGLAIQRNLASPEAKKFREDNHSFPPEIISKIPNVSVPVGRDALFTCHVKYLGDFKVGWVKEDTKAIQAIHDIVITHNPRVQVSGDFHTTFHLHISEVQEEDRGQYMCQINTVPMSSQTASLDVLVPPDITQSSGDRELRQGEMAILECVADGYPTPTISWRREDNQYIKVKDPRFGVRKVQRYEGTTLTIPKVTPNDMGAYLCIATNDIPPARSKRVYLYVQFPPLIKVKEEIMGAVYYSDMKITCEVKAYPKPIVYWNFSNGIVLNGGRYTVNEEVIRPFEMTSTLTIRNMSSLDVGRYSCVAKNSLSEASTIVRVYMVATPSPPTKVTSSVTYGFQPNNRPDFIPTKSVLLDNGVQLYPKYSEPDDPPPLLVHDNNRPQDQYDILGHNAHIKDDNESKKGHNNFGRSSGSNSQRSVKPCFCYVLNFVIWGLFEKLAFV
ncbi:hypothetical protein TCAL_08054 [Tigriopus californicus]|uniref:Ig-like domain-containing protein n=2 Tax=Tigriopus californicus TaxID=6832 RepID=A0A553NR00_TIGCA|nr:hypothetical protein TCAL_08054 [Tigriopus californicus]